jgi:hypothetical protein
MLITNIIGGLGNQMFQYAAARAISLEQGVTLKLDVSDFLNYGLHQGFELQRIFNCSIEIATAEDVQSVLGWQSSSIARRVISRPSMAWLRSTRFVVEPHFNYWNGVRDIQNNCYLVGYWQSEKYFLEHLAQIREDFKFKLPMNNRNSELAKQIKEVNAVSLHVRRGDYANNSKTTAIHGLCSIEYYKSAIKYIAERLERPVFYVFSDDIEWVKNNLQIDFPCFYIDHNNGADSFNDMRLMSNCQHHIIANSSFSWWGAWLNPSLDKIVIAPKRWFANDNDTSDLIPPHWVKL